MSVPLPVVWDTLLPTHSNEMKEHSNELFHERLIENILLGKGELYLNVIVLFNYLLKNDYLLFIASNGQREYLNSITKYYQLDQFITLVYCIQQIETMNKGILVSMILEKYGLSSRFIAGDRLSDIQSAKKNSLTAIGCRFDFAQEEELKRADYIVDDLIEIKSLLTLTSPIR